jgi:competence protein ComEC
MLNLSALVVFNALIIWGSYPWFYTVSMLYVGQGDAFLLQAPFNQSVILIDTGPPTQYANLKASVDHRGIHRIDHLIITHDDADHNGNVEALRKDYRIQNTIQLGKDIQDKWFHLKYLPVRDAKEDNDLSLVYHVQIESVRLLFMGDLGIAGELQLIKNNPDLKSDVLKLGHHGSKTSSSLMFLERVQARIALISAGKNNYGHPSRDVMERLERLAIRPLVSQTSGTVQIVITRWFRFIWVRYNLFAFF